MFGWLFGSDKARDAVLDPEKGHVSKLGGWIDRQQFTDEEKAEMRRSLMPLQIELVNALSQFKVVQRIICGTIMAGWLILLINFVAALWLGSSDIVSATIDLMISPYITVPLGGVAFVYLGGGLANSFKKGSN